jgi:hypothetical protein
MKLVLNTCILNLSSYGHEIFAAGHKASDNQLINLSNLNLINKEIILIEDDRN